jgi:hypothetical protein
MFLASLSELATRLFTATNRHFSSPFQLRALFSVQWSLDPVCLVIGLMQTVCRRLVTHSEQLVDLYLLTVHYLYVQC